MALFALVLLLTGCGGDNEPAGASAKRPPPDHLVTVHTAATGHLAAHHERPGSLRFRRLVRIHSQEEGRITELEVFEGDLVSEGDPLVQLEDDLLAAQLDKARATKQQKKLDLERQEGLRKKRAVSEDELAQARTALTVAEAEERLLETRLAFTRIRAPFAGVIIARRVEPGDFVTKNSHLLTLADPDSLVAEVYASELVLPQVGLGDPVSLRIDALGAGRFEGRVLRIHPALAQISRQAIVEIAMDPIPEGARAGQFVRATLRTAAVERLLIPFRAVRRDRVGELVWLLNDSGLVERRPVRTGLRITDRIEILEGLSPGERVVTRGFLGLAEGIAVRVVANGR
jgi:RND family efflux transporter MFP subunit